MSERSTLESWWGLTLAALVFAAAIMLLAYLASFLWPKVFDLDALQLLGANVIGVLLAAFFALEIDRRLGGRRAQRRRDDAEEKRRNRAIQALGALRDAVEHNDELVRQAVQILDESQGKVVTFRTDPRSFDPILPRVLDTTENLDLVMEASNYRYQLEHFGRKLDAQLRLYLETDYHYSGPAPRPGMGPNPLRRKLDLRETREEIVESIIEHGGVLREGGDDLIASIEDARQERTA